MAKRPSSKVSKKRGKPKKGIESTQGARNAFSRKRLDEIILRGNAFREYIEGSPPPTVKPGEEVESGGITESERAERKIMGRGWRKTSVPAHGVLRQVLLPSLVSRPPTWVNRARQKPAYEDLTPEQQEACELEKQRGKVYVELAKAIYAKSKVHQELLAAVDDAMQYGAGWLEVDFDVEHTMPRIRWQSTERVMVDMEADDDPFGKTQRWRAVCWTMSHEDAKYNAKNMWDAASHEFTPESYTFADDDDEPNDGSPSANKAPTEYVKLVRVYVAGNSPHIERAKLDADTDDQIEEVGKDDVYSGRNEVLIMEATGRWDDCDSYKLITRFDWPYPVDIGDFPLEPVKITHCNRSFYPYSIYQPGHSLQIALNWAMRYYNTDAYRSARRLIGYMEGAFDKNTLEAALHGVDNLNAIPFKSQGDMERAIKPIDFGQPNPALEKTIAGNQVQYDKATGLDAFNLEARSHRTATDAAIQNEESQLRVGAMADRVEEAVTNAMRKALMCARALMTAEEVADVIGPELLKLEDRVDEKGNVVKYSPVWDDRVADPKAIRREVDIHLEQRSLRFVSPEQELNDMDRLAMKQIEMLKVVGDINVQNPVLAEAFARANNAMIRAYADRLHLPNADEYLIDLRAALTPPMPEQPAGGPGGPVPQAQPPGQPPAGPVTQQLAGAVNELGLSPERLPGGLADQVARVQ